MCMTSCYNLIKWEGHVQNCTASYWSFFISQVGHMIVVCFDWLWLARMGHMTTTNCHAVFNWIVFIRWYCLFRKQEYSLIKVFDNIYTGSYPSVINMAMQGADYPRFGVLGTFKLYIIYSIYYVKWPSYTVTTSFKLKKNGRRGRNSSYVVQLRCGKVTVLLSGYLNFKLL